MHDERPGDGIVTLTSRHSVADTVRRLVQMLESKSIKIFAVIDHSGEAEKAGLKMPDTKLIIFGNPKAGTPLMIAAPSIAIDLPLKMLIREDEERRVSISYNDPDFLRSRHDLPGDLMPTLAAVGSLAEQLAD